MLHVERMVDGEGRTVLAVSGEVDLATMPALTEALAQAHRDGAAGIVVDLAAVDFMDSSGVRVLVEAAHRAEQAGVPLSVRGARGWVARVLEITGVGEFLNMTPAPSVAAGGAASDIDQPGR